MTSDTATTMILPRVSGAPLPPAGTPATLVADRVSAWFGDHHVLDEVNLVMPARQVTALIGPSGCGKSTFLRILNRMHELVPGASLAGEVLLDGTDIYDAGRRPIDSRSADRHGLPEGQPIPDHVGLRQRPRRDEPHRTQDPQRGRPRRAQSAERGAVGRGEDPARHLRLDRCRVDSSSGSALPEPSPYAPTYS